MRLGGGELRSPHSRLRTLLRSPGRQTNQALLVMLVFAFEAAISALALPGARRRFTGSYETASFRPGATPTTAA